MAVPLRGVVFVVELPLVVTPLDEVLHRHRLVVEHNIQIPVLLAQHRRHILAGPQGRHILEEPRLYHIPEELRTFLTGMSVSTEISRCTAVPSVPTIWAGRSMADPVPTMPK